MHMMHISTPSGPAQRPPVQDFPESVPYPCFQPDGNASTLPPDPRTFLFPFRIADDSEAIQKNKTETMRRSKFHACGSGKIST